VNQPPTTEIRWCGRCRAKFYGGERAFDGGRDAVSIGPRLPRDPEKKVCLRSWGGGVGGREVYLQSRLLKRTVLVARVERRASDARRSSRLASLAALYLG